MKPNVIVVGGNKKPKSAFQKRKDLSSINLSKYRKHRKKYRGFRYIEGKGQIGKPGKIGDKIKPSWSYYK